MPPRTPIARKERAPRKLGPSSIGIQKPASSQLSIKPQIAFFIFAAGNILAALYAPIQDCDEVFNYWEPTHYLSHGYGLQTWEYSPEYSIRSWLYVSLHAAMGKIVYLLTSNKTLEFYWIRITLALTCAYCESVFFATISKILDPLIGVMFMIVMITSPGTFHAVAAFLPSSFSMYANMLGAIAFMDWRDGSKTATGIMWFGIGGIVGWPFATALVTPFLLEEFILAIMARDVVKLLYRCVNGAARCIFVMLLQMAIEAFFYRKLVIVPWNIVAYNVFSGSGKGPDIFGTEPADYYIRNLLLNFNIWVLLSLAVWPLVAIQYFWGTKAPSFSIFRSVVFTAPFYLWLAIFSAQPHKEERFMYPAYPFLALNAAIALHVLLVWLGNADPRYLLGKIPARLKLLAVAIVVLFAIDIGLLRTMGLVTAYRAPLNIFSSLQEQAGLGREGSLCLGKEWYRFPSSFFLPNGTHAKFVQSEFNGLLPGQFSEAGADSGLFLGTSLVPAGMNDQNLADPGKYTEVAHCDFLVDSQFPNSVASKLEPDYIQDTTTWEKIRCEKFLDARNTKLLARLIWVPDIPGVPAKYKRKWGEYCLLRRRKSN